MVSDSEEFILRLSSSDSEADVQLCEPKTHSGTVEFTINIGICPIKFYSKRAQSDYFTKVKCKNIEKGNAKKVNKEEEFTIENLNNSNEQYGRDKNNNNKEIIVISSDEETSNKREKEKSSNPKKSNLSSSAKRSTKSSKKRFLYKVVSESDISLESNSDDDDYNPVATKKVKKSPRPKNSTTKSGEVKRQQDEKKAITPKNNSGSRIEDDEKEEQDEKKTKKLEYNSKNEDTESEVSDDDNVDSESDDSLIYKKKGRSITNSSNKINTAKKCNQRAQFLKEVKELDKSVIISETRVTRGRYLQKSQAECIKPTYRRIMLIDNSDSE